MNISTSRWHTHIRMYTMNITIMSTHRTIPLVNLIPIFIGMVR